MEVWVLESEGIVKASINRIQEIVESLNEIYWEQDESRQNQVL